MILAILTLSFANVFAQESNIKVTNSNYKDSHAMWSPVEDLILFESNMEGKTSIYIVNSCGENIRRLTSLEYEDWLASWSPDGRQIAYSSMRNNKYQIFIYDLNSNTHRQLITSKSSDYGPGWSPDGKQITYSSKLNEGRNVREIFIIDTDGKNKKRLTHNRGLNGLPVFSVDGRSIFFQSNAYTNSSSKNDILSYDLSTSKIERITHTNTGGGIDPFIYAPNNSLAFFTSNRGAPEGSGTYWIDLKTKKMTKFDIKSKNPGHPTWSFDGQYVTIIDRKLKEICIYDIDNSKSIKVTGKLKINGN